MHLYFRFWPYARPYWHLALGAAVALIINGFLAAYPIQLFQQAIDRAVSGDATAALFYFLALQYLALRLALGLMHVVEAYLMKRLTQGIIFNLRSDLYAHMQKLSVGYYESKGAGEVLSRALGDVGAVTDGFVTPMVRLGGELTALFWALFFLLHIDWRLTLVALLVAPPLGLLVYLFGNRLRGNSVKLHETNARMWSLMSESISAMPEIKVFTREEHELGRFQKICREGDALALKDSLLHTCLTFLTGLLFSAGEMVVLLLGGLSLYYGSLSAGMLTAFLMYLRMLYSPVITLSRRYDQSQRTLTAAARVFEVFDTPTEVPERQDAKALPSTAGELRFEDVCFSYDPKRKPVLNGVSFVAAPGTLNALVGLSGAGKTTLTKLVPRLYDPTQGKVLLDGVDLRDIRLKDLRSQIAVVFQEPFLFNATIAENIAYGDPQASFEQIEAAAAAANADEFINLLPERYQTPVGQRGSKLSVGQRQRIAIARALIRNPRILVLDEATSAVDSKTERLVQGALERLLKGRTCFVIAHRLSTIVHADQILVVQGGRIVERGRHEELVANSSGCYAELYRHFSKPHRSASEARQRRPTGSCVEKGG